MAYAVCGLRDLCRALIIERADHIEDVVGAGRMAKILSAFACICGALTSESACTTICTVSPASWGNFSWRVSAAALDSDPGCR